MNFVDLGPIFVHGPAGPLYRPMGWRGAPPPGRTKPPKAFAKALTASRRALTTGKHWNTLEWEAIRAVLAGSRVCPESPFHWLPTVLVEKILIAAHNPRWRPAFTSFSGAPPPQSVSITQGGKRLTFPCNETPDDDLVYPSVALDGTGFQYLELHLSYLHIGSGVAFVRTEGDGDPNERHQELNISFEAELQGPGQSALDWGEDTVVICSERDFPSDKPSVPDDDGPNAWIHHVVGWNGWAGNDPGETSGTLNLLLDFDRRSVRLGLNGVPGPLFSLGAAPLRLALSGFFGNGGEKAVLKDGAIRRKRVSATLSTPDTVPAPMAKALNSDCGICDEGDNCDHCYFDALRDQAAAGEAGPSAAGETLPVGPGWLPGGAVG